MPLIVQFLCSVWALISYFAYRVTKWLLRKITRLTELQRIVYGELRGARRTRLVESSLTASRNPGINEELLDLQRAVVDGRFESRGSRKALVLKAASKIGIAKGINLTLHSRFVTGLAECLEAIYAMKYMNDRLLVIRKTHYDVNNTTHEAKLLKIWDQFIGSAKTLDARRCESWKYLGFQGTDPATDFRGAGMLAVEFLLYCSREHGKTASILLENSHSPKHNFPFAILAIQLTFDCSELCLTGAAKSHFYNRIHTLLSLDDNVGGDNKSYEQELTEAFYEFAFVVLIEFNGFWMDSKPRDLMDFGPIKARFDERIKHKLKSDECCFLLQIRNV